MRNRFNLSESEKNYIRGLHGIEVITEQGGEGTFNAEDEGYVGEGCTEAQLALGMEPIPGGGCGCPPGTEEDENGKCVASEVENPEEEASVDESEDADILVDDDLEVDVDENELADDEDSWLAERWEDLTDAVRNIFSRNKKFAGCRRMDKCPDFNKMNRRRKLRILSNLTKAFPKFRWPRFRFRLPDINMALMMWKIKRRSRKNDRQWRKFKKSHGWG